MRPGRGATVMLLRRLMIPAVAVALALSLGLTAIGFWAGRTIVQVMSDRLIREVTQAVSRDVAHIVGGVDRALSGVANDLVRHDVPLGDPRRCGTGTLWLADRGAGCGLALFRQRGRRDRLGRAAGGRKDSVSDDGRIPRRHHAPVRGVAERRDRPAYEIGSRFRYAPEDLVHARKGDEQAVLDRSLSGRRTHRRRFSLHPRHRQERQLRRSVRDRPYPDTARQPHADAPAR